VRLSLSGFSLSPIVGGRPRIHWQIPAEDVGASRVLSIAAGRVGGAWEGMMTGRNAHHG